MKGIMFNTLLLNSFRKLCVYTNDATIVYIKKIALKA